MPRWSREPASLTVTDDLVIAELADLAGKVTTHGLPHRMLGEPGWRGPLCEQVGIVAVAEASAWLSELGLPVLDRVRAQVRGRLGTTPCRCAVLPATVVDHGAMRVLARAEHGGTTAEVGRCTVCGRCWTFVSGEPVVRTPHDGAW